MMPAARPVLYLSQPIDKAPDLLLRTVPMLRVPRLARFFVNVRVFVHGQFHASGAQQGLC
jgi:hypothetical protein